MKIKAFSFEKNSYTLASVKQDASSQLEESGICFESYSDPNSLFENVSKALEDNDVLLIGVETNLFLKFKPVLIKAFNFTPAYSEKIDTAIGSAITDDKLRKAHTLVPEECAELISKEGMYSGFYVKSSEQYIVVFPLDNELTVEMLTSSGLPFFKVPENREELYAEIGAADKASSKAEAIVTKLLKNNLKLAIPTTPASKVLKEDIRCCANNENLVYFTPFVKDSGVKDPKEYAAQLAKGAMDLRSTVIGAAISNIFREKQGDNVTSYYSFVCVATEDKIIVKKLFADANESVDNLIIEATCELYLMIEKYLDEIIFKLNATDEEKALYEKGVIEAELQKEMRPAASIGKKGTIIAVAALLVITAICVILGFKFDGYFVNPSDAPETTALQSGEAKETESTTLGQIPENTLKPEATDEITEYPDESDTVTSIFEVEPTSMLTPVPNTGNPVINYTPNTNTGPVTTTQAPTTTVPTTKEETTKKETTTEAPTTEKDDSGIQVEEEEW